MTDLDKLQRKFASRSESFWAEMRNNLHLLDKAQSVQESTIDALRYELSDILDSGILSYPQTLDEVGIPPDSSLEDKKRYLGITSVHTERTKNEEKFLESMAHKADCVRKSNWAWRISQEHEEKHLLRWHPFFITLTINPDYCDGKQHYTPEGKALPIYDSPKDLWQKGRELRKYIRSLANMVCAELKHPPVNKINKQWPEYRRESDYVTYAGVIEHGKSREHHHGHFIVWLRAVPPSWRTCPNHGIRNPKYRTRNECLPLRTYWDWSLPGLSPALYFRSIGDIWETDYQFDLPLDKKTGKPMKVGPPRVVGDYIAKYLAKEHREWHHRMKATRNLGLSKLKTTIRSLDDKVVQALTWRASTSKLNLSVMQTHSVPLGLMRSITKRELYFRKFRSNRLELRDLLSVNSNIFSRMLASVRHGARPDRMDSSEFYDWVGKCLPGQKGYSDQRLIEAHELLTGLFPVDKAKIAHVKLGANDIGHP